MKLNKDILNLVDALQAYRRYIISKDVLEGTKTNWWKECEELFYSKIKHSIGKSSHNFETLMYFKVTEEMSRTVYDELGKFEIDLH